MIVAKLYYPQSEIKHDLAVSLSQEAKGDYYTAPSCMKILKKNSPHYMLHIKINAGFQI